MNCGPPAPTDVAIAPIDVSDANEVFAAADRFAGELGPIDIWVNDAMVTVFSLVGDITPEEFRRVTEVTYLGVVYGSMAALKQMRTQPSGQIINIGSALAYRGIPLQSAYCGAKHAIRGFTASLRAELEHEHSPIVVSILELPAMNTPQFDWARTHRAHQPKPMGTIYQPEAAAEAVLLAARTGASEYWVGTSTLLTIVGNMIAPKFMDWFLARSAVAGQETNQLVKPCRRDNLMQPVADLHRCTARSAPKRSQMSLSIQERQRARRSWPGEPCYSSGWASSWRSVGRAVRAYRTAEVLRHASHHRRGNCAEADLGPEAISPVASNDLFRPVRKQAIAPRAASMDGVQYYRDCTSIGAKLQLREAGGRSDYSTRSSSPSPPSITLTLM